MKIISNVYKYKAYLKYSRVCLFVRKISALDCNHIPPPKKNPFETNRISATASNLVTYHFHVHISIYVS